MFDVFDQPEDERDATVPWPGYVIPHDRFEIGSVGYPSDVQNLHMVVVHHDLHRHHLPVVVVDDGVEYRLANSGKRIRGVLDHRQTSISHRGGRILHLDQIDGHVHLEVEGRPDLIVEQDVCILHTGYAYHRPSGDPLRGIREQHRGGTGRLPSCRQLQLIEYRLGRELHL